MKKLFVLLILLCSYTTLLAQKYLTRTGQIIFDASTPLENIHGVNNEAAAILDPATGNIVFQVLIKSFKLEKELMQEHFNEDYMESNQYPKANFKGKILDAGKISFTKDGTYKVQVKGQLNMHGVTKTIVMPASVIIKGDNIDVHANFTIQTADYNITIPALVRDKIAKEVKITVNGRFTKK
jgi:polyisoprenoid-binding protein YceI